MSRTSAAADNAAYNNFDKKGFWSLFVVMAQGAFNDNVLKFVVLYFLIDQAKSGDAYMFGIKMNEYYINGLGTIIFSLPFVLFAGAVGAICDRYSKRTVTIYTKMLEVVIAGVMLFAFSANSWYFLFGIVFLMAAQSAIFGPAKYGLLPETLPESRLSWANGVVAMGTLIAVILGTGLAGPLKDLLGPSIKWSALVLMFFSGIGLIAAFRVQHVPAANPSQRIPLVPWGGLTRYFRIILGDRQLMHVFAGYVFFWFAGVVIQQTVTVLVANHPGVADGVRATFNSVCLAFTALGIGSGSLIAGLASRRKIELGLVPLGTLGLAVLGILLSVYSAHLYLLVALLFGMGFAAGFFDVPLAATVQKRSPSHARGGIMAAGNFLTFLGMLFGGALFALFGRLGLSPEQIFLFIAVCSLIVGVYMMSALPFIIVRAVMWILSNTVFRINVLGRTNIPDEGGALYVANPMSLFDVLCILCATDRQIHCVVGEDALKTPWARRLVRMTGMVTLDPNAPAREQERVYREIQKLLADGHVVMISTEGPHKSDGSLALFQEDYRMLIGDLKVPVHPVHIDRLWGMIYLIENNRFRFRWPVRMPYPIMVNFGAAMPPDPVAVRKELHTLGVAAYEARPRTCQQLHHGFIRSARRNLFRMAIADTVSGELNYFKTLVGSIAFARKLKVLLDGHEMVGVLVPPSVGGILTNVALQMMGRVPVNLNYTASNEVIASCARQCNITQTLTAKKLIERLPLEVPGQSIYLEDIRETVSSKDRIVAMLIALFMPIRMIEKMLGNPGRSIDDLATIVFSSGSEGDPKGVMLTQRNIIVNVEAGYEIFPHDKNTCIVGYLPLFHSFGFTVTLWMVLMWGLRGIYHSNPLEPKVIGGLIEKHRATLMIGTSTFLQHFIRKCTPEQFASLEFVVCGAEKLAPRVRDAFQEKFGIEPLEGYGTTECAPAVSINVPDLVSPGFCSKRTLRGSIGRAIPGDEMRVVDPDTEVELPLNTPGLLQVRGPNIMQGYLGQPEKTAKVLKDGWYSTGDIAAIDLEGFVRITDRLARFSKIGGEMVPHNKIEEVMHDLLGLTDQSVAIASVPDAQKGERLVVLHILDEEQLAELLSKLDNSGLPNLWIPRASAFYRIEAIPVLATGKMDIKSVKQMAQAFDVGG